LVLDEKLVIQPHQNVARIQAILCNNENIDRHEYCGFLIDYVEIRPIALAPEKNRKAIVHNDDPMHKPESTQSTYTNHTFVLRGDSGYYRYLCVKTRHPKVHH
jgi:hypothetical protein